MRGTRIAVALATCEALLAGACQGAAPGASPTGGAASPSAGGSAGGGEQASVRLQLQWAPQAQFAGYFAAAEEGFYEAEGLDVEILPGGPDVVPQQVGCAGQAEFTIAWVPKVLEAREQGCDLVNIAQVFQRSGTLSVSWKDSNITEPADFEGKKVGVWDFGNEYEVTAAAKQAGLEENEDYTKVIQPFDMTLLLSREIDVAEAMIYNEYAQVLEAENPETGQLYQPQDLNVIDYNQVGTAMLQDAIWASEAWLSQGNNADVAVRFLRASFRGWVTCRENQQACIDHTVAAGSTLGAGHQAWMMNEINALIWPSENGIGDLDADAWAQTVAISLDAGIISEEPPASAYRTDLASDAREAMTEDAVGADFQKGEVEVTPGGN